MQLIWKEFLLQKIVSWFSLKILVSIKWHSSKAKKLLDQNLWPPVGVSSPYIFFMVSCKQSRPMQRCFLSPAPHSPYLTSPHVFACGCYKKVLGKQTKNKIQHFFSAFFECEMKLFACSRCNFICIFKHLSCQNKNRMDKEKKEEWCNEDVWCVWKWKSRVK